MDDSRTFLTHRIEALEAQVFAVRRALLRAATLGLALLLVLGSWVPIGVDGVDGESHTVRLVTAWYVYLVVPRGDSGHLDEGAGGGGTGLVLGLVLTGLLLCVLAMLWVLAYEVVPGSGRPGLVRLRGWLAAALVLGGLGAVVLSVVLATSGSGLERGGWGSVVLVLGATGAAALLAQERVRELWVLPTPPRPGGAGRSGS